MMISRQTVSPDPIVTPADIPGTHASNDVFVAGWIAAAQEAIDGPTGWVGRSFGEQTIETFITVENDNPIEIPYPPIIEVLSVYSVSDDGVETETSIPMVRTSDGIRIQPTGFRGSLKVVYRAGYDGEPIADGGTGDIPVRAKQAVILAATYGKSMDVTNLAVRTETVEGLGSTTYVVSDAASDMIDLTTRRLLNGLRIIRV